MVHLTKEDLARKSNFQFGTIWEQEKRIPWGQLHWITMRKLKIMSRYRTQQCKPIEAMSVITPSNLLMMRVRPIISRDLIIINLEQNKLQDTNPAIQTSSKQQIDVQITTNVNLRVTAFTRKNSRKKRWRIRKMCGKLLIESSQSQKNHRNKMN